MMNKRIASQRSTEKQLDLLDWSLDVPLHSYAKARPYIGDFFEEASKELFDAVRLKTQAGRWCPDLQARTGEFFEIKSVGKSRGSLIFNHRAREDQRFMAEGHALYYVFWHHSAHITDQATVSSLWAHLALSVDRVTVVPAKVVYKTIEAARSRFTSYSGDAGRDFGKIYKLKPAKCVSPKALRSWETGQAEFSFIKRVYGFRIPPIPVYGLF